MVSQTTYNVNCSAVFELTVIRPFFWLQQTSKVELVTIYISSHFLMVHFLCLFVLFFKLIASAYVCRECRWILFNFRRYRIALKRFHREHNSDFDMKLLISDFVIKFEYDACCHWLKERALSEYKA